jgi:Activator of Hsp90 ATPase homolog 1-like protein
METRNLHKTITVNASAKEVMKKISQVDHWWIKGTEGKTEKLNDKFHVPMGKTFIDFQITEVVPNKKVVWNVTDCCIPWLKDTKEWNGTQVVFEISEKENAAQIDFTHIGLTPEVECYTACEEGWNNYITSSLVKFINEGKGMPKEF